MTRGRITGTVEIAAKARFVEPSSSLSFVRKYSMVLKKVQLYFWVKGSASHLQASSLEGMHAYLAHHLGIAGVKQESMVNAEHVRLAATEVF